MVGIFLFTRDLRLKDNPGIYQLLQDVDSVIPLFVLDESCEHTKTYGSAQKWWLHHSLLSLSQDIEKKGSRLIIRRGRLSEEVFKLTQETDASNVYLNRCYDPYVVQEISKLEKTLTTHNIHMQSFKANLLFEPWEIKNKTNSHFKVFTPFWKNCLNSGIKRNLSPSITKFPSLPQVIKSESIHNLELLPNNPDWAASFKDDWTPGEEGAWETLDNFLEDTGKNYRLNRDLPQTNGTSRLSPHLHFGEISPNQILNEIEKRRAFDKLSLFPEDIKIFQQELGWREFNYHLLYQCPHLAEQNFNISFDTFPWKVDPENFKKWCHGQTGYPIVDAGMRQLWKTGWMHNRVRMITASFLIKDLLIDWRQGEKWFWDTLLDADHASNPGNWQWVAGSGADAAPYFRIFNPVLQGEKFDPAGEYVRKWIAELQNLPDKYIHCPWETPPLILKSSGIILGDTYPLPIVDHKKARQIALVAYKNSRIP